jgi:hypothetical protein
MCYLFLATGTKRDTMQKELLSQAVEALQAGENQKADKLIARLAQFSDSAMEMLIKTLHKGGSVEAYAAILVLQRMGFPANEPAIPELLYHIGDANLLGWQEAVETLMQMDREVVITHLFAALLSKSAPYHANEGRPYETWAWDVEGICVMLAREDVDAEYARRCCPATSYLLAQAILTGKPEIDDLLFAFEQAGDAAEMALPSLLHLAEYHEQELTRERARDLIARISPKKRRPYHLLLTRFAVPVSDLPEK